MSDARPVSSERLASLVCQKRILVCCGAGGVGKTTTAAALGLAGARAGRRVLVLTIDPARRLAEAMGIPEAGTRPSPVPRDRLEEAGVGPEGSLDAWMLNPAVVFEGMVRRLAPDEQRARAILDNRIYRQISQMVAGMQEYTAAEAVYDLATGGDYDLVVLDTPPSRNALEFLEAPGRLTRFLDERIVSFFLPDGARRTGRFWRKAAELINTVFARVFGQSFYDELLQFMGAFSGMFAAMRLHADGVKAMLGSDAAAFLIVTSPEQAALSEAAYMRDRILEMDLPFAGYVLNRSYACTDGLRDPEAVALPPDAPESARSALEKLVRLAQDEYARVERDRGLLERLAKLAPSGAVAVAAPHLGESIEDLKGLMQLASGLTEGSGGG
ncbi:MAG: ArsA family ATPase [Myxococcales bacterium]|jgi:anion-transporting  ArsA/GET3 family ATPase